MTREEIIRILLVDDVELDRHTLRTILSAYSAYRNCGGSLRPRRGSRVGPTMRSLGGAKDHAGARLHEEIMKTVVYRTAMLS